MQRQRAVDRRAEQMRGGTRAPDALYIRELYRRTGEPGCHAPDCEYDYEYNTTLYNEARISDIICNPKNLRHGFAFVLHDTAKVGYISTVSSEVHCKARCNPRSRAANSRNFVCAIGGGGKRSKLTLCNIELQYVNNIEITTAVFTDIYYYRDMIFAKENFLLTISFFDVSERSDGPKLR